MVYASEIQVELNMRLEELFLEIYFGGSDARSFLLIFRFQFCPRNRSMSS